MENVREKLNDISKLVINGQLLDAFEKYYHDDVIMQENENIPTVGKTANLLREKEFLNNITEFREAKMLSSGVGDNVSYAEWKYDYTHSEWGIRNYTQVSVQHWKDGKIIKEQFFYAN